MAIPDAPEPHLRDWRELHKAIDPHPLTSTKQHTPGGSTTGNITRSPCKTLVSSTFAMLPQLIPQLMPTESIFNNVLTNIIFPKGVSYLFIFMTPFYIAQNKVIFDKHKLNCAVSTEKFFCYIQLFHWKLNIFVLEITPFKRANLVNISKVLD